MLQPASVEAGTTSWCAATGGAERAATGWAARGDDAGTGQDFCWKRRLKVLQPWQQMLEPTTAASSRFSFLLQTAIVFAGTIKHFSWNQRFHGCEYRRIIIIFFAGNRIFWCGPREILLQPTILFAGSIRIFCYDLVLFCLCWNQPKIGYHRLSILLEPALFSASIERLEIFVVFSFLLDEAISFATTGFFKASTMSNFWYYQSTFLLHPLFMVATVLQARRRAQKESAAGELQP